MTTNDTILHSVDRFLANFFAGWDVYTTILTLIFLAYLGYPLFFDQDADTHPLLLARQSAASPVRFSGESAIYRSSETPHGYPLRSGLNVKDPGAPKWTSGRDGDLRDIWKKALGSGDDKTGRVISVMGKESTEHNFDILTGQLNAIGTHLQKQGAKKVAIYLPNSVELIVAFFATTFYGFTPILIPQNQTFETLADILHDTHADVLFAPAGTVPAEHLAMSCPNVKKTIWVVEETSRHMDFGVDPSKTQTADEWHAIIGDASPAGTSDLPSTEEIPNIICISSKAGTPSFTVVEFTQDNIVAAVAAQISALPRNLKIESSDLVLPLDSLSTLYPMVMVLVALYSNASIALPTAAGKGVDYDVAFQSVSPSIVIASAQTMFQVHGERLAAAGGILSKLQHNIRSRALSAGRMKKAKAQQGPRLIFISTSAEAGSVRLTSKQMNDLRIFTGARIIYSLTTTHVAGPITQTSAFDYRSAPSTLQSSHFGAPLSSLEMKLVETPELKISDDADPVGHIVVGGPAVVGGKQNIEVVGSILEDHTLAL